MRLSKVTYRVFEREAEGPWAAEATAWHQLDGEIMLTFTDGKREYIVSAQPYHIVGKLPL